MHRGGGDRGADHRSGDLGADRIAAEHHRGHRRPDHDRSPRCRWGRLRPVADDPGPTPPPPSPGSEPGFTGEGTVVIAAGGAELRPTRRRRTGGHRSGKGWCCAGLGQSDDGVWTRVLTTCDERMWVPTDRIHGTPPAPPARIGVGFDFADAVIVVDAGHGGPNTGAQSPDGLVEKDNNLVIAARLRDLLSRPSTIDWETGAIHNGDRGPGGGAGDHDQGGRRAGRRLRGRSDLPGRGGQHRPRPCPGVDPHQRRLGPGTPTIPGSDVFYQSQHGVTADSRRLATLMVEELRRGLAPVRRRLGGDHLIGAKSRLSPRTGGQYYGILEDVRGAGSDRRGRLHRQRQRGGAARRPRSSSRPTPTPCTGRWCASSPPTTPATRPATTQRSGTAACSTAAPSPTARSLCRADSRETTPSAAADLRTPPTSPGASR